MSIFSVILVSLIFSWLTFFRLADWKEEITLWQREIELKPNDWRTQSNYAYALETQNKSAEAIEYYKKTLITAPKADLEISTARNLAGAYSRIGEQNKAEAILLAALKRFPGNEILLFELARTYLKNKQHEKSAEIFNFLSKKNNNDVVAFFAILSEKLNGKEAIKSEIEEIKNPRLREQTPFLIMGKEKMLEGKWEEAIAAFNNALQNSPTPVFEIYLWVAESFEKINEKEKALDAYQIALALSPSSIDAAQGIIRNSQSQ